ncbi:MAG TPA: peptidylprolyl isomerase [Candidatus Krumholzibacteria bacterium]|nr:peptidylprolyl isomerase [Candidatus Krumholzibacteria bacterium]
MMQVLRERVKVVFWLIIVTFIGFTFLAWGIGDWSAPQQTGDSTVVATVNGADIGAMEWERRAQSILSSMSAQQGATSEITESDRLRARDRAYSELIDEVLLEAEAERRGLSVTDAEITDILRNNPPPALLAQYDDIDQYYEDLDNPSVNWNQVRESLRQTIPLQKLQQRIMASAVVGEAELRQAYREQNTRMVAEYVGVRFSDVELEDETVSDAEARRWYEANLGDYKQPARTSVSLLKVEKAASEEDEQEILSILSEIREDIVSGRLTFEEAARTYSEDTSASVGGDLGFFDRNRMTEPFTEVAFDLAVGDVSEPVKTQFGYHIIECTDERLNDAGEREEMRARHLLLELAPSTATVDELREQVDTAQQTARTAGLAAAADQLGVEIVETAPFQEGFNIPGVRNSLPASRFAFSNDVGALSPMFETEDALYFFTVAEKFPAGHRALEDVRSLVDSAVLNDRRAEIAGERLREALQSAGADTGLEALADDDDLIQHAVTDTFTLRQNIQDIGFATPFARAALAMDVGDFEEDVRTQRGVYALELLYKEEFDEEAFASMRSQLARQVMFTRQRVLLQQWIEEQRGAAEIVDRRAELL